MTEGGGVAAADVEERDGVADPVGMVAAAEAGAFEGEGLWAVLLRETPEGGPCAVLERSSPRLVEGAGVEITCGARPVATERGSAERPIRWPASWLAAQASAALTAMPSTAATAVATDRLVMGQAHSAHARQARAKRRARAPRAGPLGAGGG